MPENPAKRWDADLGERELREVHLAAVAERLVPTVWLNGAGMTHEGVAAKAFALAESFLALAEARLQVARTRDQEVIDG